MTFRNVLIVFLVGCCNLVNSALAQDVLITNFNPNFPTSLPPVFRVNTVDGSQEAVVPAGTALRPSGIAFDAAGNLYVSDLVTGDILPLDLDTGVLGMPVVSGVYAVDMVPAAGGLLLVDNSASNSKLIRVDTNSGATTVISSALPKPIAGIAVESDGKILAAALNAGVVIRIDPMTGAQTYLATGILENPAGVTVAANGDIYVADVNAGGTSPGDGSIIKIDPVTEAQTVVSEGGLFRDPQELLIDGNGDLLVLDSTSGNPNPTKIVRVDVSTGAQNTVSDQGFFTINARDIVAIPENDLTPNEQIIKLVEDVIALNLKKGISNALDSKLQNALAALEDANSNNDVAATNMLNAFISSASAQSGKELETGQADDLIAKAQAILNTLAAN